MEKKVKLIESKMVTVVLEGGQEFSASRVRIALERLADTYTGCYISLGDSELQTALMGENVLVYGAGAEVRAGGRFDVFREQFEKLFPNDNRLVAAVL